ncbi:hypothetical protein HanPI659440_Chr10g0365451 [Helianthus annuus]|nr:hypothetical protein HanPI659440_Chr10g0365451 [Helianthus annuus]
MQVACGRSTGLWCLEGSLESGEDPRPCGWSLLFVNQAGGLEESFDASSVPVRMVRLMRNSQPRVGCHLLVCRTNLRPCWAYAQTSNRSLRWWLKVCTNFEPTFEVVNEEESFLM